MKSQKPPTDVEQLVGARRSGRRVRRAFPRSAADFVAHHARRLCRNGTFLALVCATLEKIASDVKVIMATEIAEVQEPDGGGGRGASSTMPQKRNPISCA